MVLTLAAGSMSAMGFGKSPAEEDPPPQWLIRNVIRWMPLVERWGEDFPDLKHALVLSVIAQESQGFPYSESGDGYGSVGLMQVIPRSWTGSRTQLLNPAYNIYVGMRMLDATIVKAGSVRKGVAAYNCGFVSLEAGNCWSFGGYVYADRVLDYWSPIFRSELQETRWAQLTSTPTQPAPTQTLIPLPCPLPTEQPA